MGETRQRWRLIVAPRGAQTGPARSGAWAEDAGAGVPAATETAHPRPRIAFAAPLPADALAEREPIDLFLAERLRIAELRPRLLDALPPGHDLVDLFDVWAGAPALAARVVGADYRVEVRDGRSSRLLGSSPRRARSGRRRGSG
jgi:hypothetical protein